ncbi:hypothetical protein LDHU3_30.4660:CDS1 [Leishmania donovani]|uniref:Hypothetical_protein n=1 Tax=Leishmania donovani TaxID=5661 RepID=A0A6J8FGY4_LEIDO|nr:hypothetical protein LDHU3_30.4660:CDS1 [Leishmania donovani]VDZ46990.1 hypothetical_protein [Leishmania donovani]
MTVSPPHGIRLFLSPLRASHKRTHAQATKSPDPFTTQPLPSFSWVPTSPSWCASDQEKMDRTTHPLQPAAAPPMRRLFHPPLSHTCFEACDIAALPRAVSGRRCAVPLRKMRRRAARTAVTHTYTRPTPSTGATAWPWRGASTSLLRLCRRSPSSHCVVWPTAAAKRRW